MENKFLIFLMFFSLALRIYLFLDLGSILGSDVGRFAIISHVWFLKGKITQDLRPYDLAQGFFYFPGVLLLPFAFEFLGIDPITTITFFSFLFSFLGTLVFYKIARIYLNEKQSTSAYFFYSFIFDIVLIFNIFGVWPYGFASFFFLLIIYYFSKLYFSKIEKKHFIILFLGTFGIILFHWYLLMPYLIFMFSLFTYEFVKFNSFKKTKKMILNAGLSLSLSLFLIFPYLLKFYEYVGLWKKPYNIADLLTFLVKRSELNIFQRFETIYFISYMGAIYSSVLVASFFLFIFCLKDFLKDKKIVWVYFFVFISVHAFSVFFELNLLRIATFLWLGYTLALGYKFKNPYLYSLVLPFLFFIPSPSIFYLLYTLKFQPELYTPLVNFHHFNEAMSWIKHNTPLNSTFLIDGGGAGCTGTSASYGERIFPLTSRRIFYFTDYCWAEYNRSEFVKRVDLYRRISINTSCCIEELKNYNITHVFIGERWIALDPSRFNNQYYKLVYDKNGYKIYEIV